MNQLLLATDLSLRCDRALRRALVLAGRLEAKLTIVHVVEADIGDRALDAGIARARSLLHEQVEAALRESEGKPEVEVVVSHGRAFAEIVRIALKLGADLVITGFQRDDPFRELFLGSTINRVLKVGCVPTLIVKRASMKTYCNVLAGVDFAPPSQRAVEMALVLADEHAHVQLVHAYEVVLPALTGSLGSGPIEQYHEAFRAQSELDMETFLDRFPDDTRISGDVHEGAPAPILASEAEKMAVDLVALGTHGRGRVQSAFLGNTTAKLIRDLDSDILAVREGKPIR